MPQLNLSFIDIPIPQESLWEELNHQQKQTIIEGLARLMLKAAVTAQTPEPAEAPKEAAHD
jgi:hypothetical protein